MMGVRDDYLGALGGGKVNRNTAGAASHGHDCA